jgi:hypothetical protein
MDRKACCFLLIAVTIPAFAIVIPGVITSSGQITDPSYFLAPYGTVQDRVNLNGVVWISTGGACAPER